MGSVKTVNPHHLQILCEFICECTYLHTFICKLKIKTFCAFAVTCRHAQKVKNLSHSVHISSLSWTRWCSAILFQHLQHKLHILFMVYLVPGVLNFVAFWWWFLFKMAPKQNTEVLSSVPKCKKAMMCLMEKICVRFYSGIS